MSQRLTCTIFTLQLNEEKGTLNLQVSLDGLHFAEGRFPPGMSIENKVNPLHSTPLLPDLAR